MKYTKTLAAVAGLLCAAATSQAAITLNIASTSGATIAFTGGGNFGFTPTTGNNFFITGLNGPGVGDSVNDLGLITGAYSFNPTTGVVTGSGTLSISDGTKNLTANVTWDTISQTGTGGNLNIGGTLNLTGITYTGSQKDLQQLSTVGTGVATIAFSFTTAQSLASLAAGGESTSFAGAISTAVPEPTTVVAGALLLLPFGLSAMRILRKKNVETLA